MLFKLFKPLIISGLCLVFLIGKINAADTLRLSLREIDQRFLEKNLPLMVAKSNIDINKAFTDQAKLWDNPAVLFENNLINFQVPRVLDGQQFLQVSQLFRLAKKRQKLVSLSQETERLSEAQFYDLMRSLRHQLHADFHDLAYIDRQLTWYVTQISAFDQLSKTVAEQVAAGNMAQKEVIRLQSQLVQLQLEASNLQRSKIPLQSELQALLGESKMLLIEPQEDPLSIDVSKLTSTELINTAYTNRPDLKIADVNISIQEKNLIYQKALAKPDLTVGMTYDRQNSYVPHYVGIQLGVPLPFLNKNQGNIKAAELGIKQQQTAREAVQVQVGSEVMSAYRRIVDLQAWQAGQSAAFYKTFESFYQSNVVKSFQTRQITLVEFMDFFQTYQQNQLQQLEQNLKLRQAVEDLHFVIGKDVLN
jgi:outer membrane protein, heavy metal efflux system